MDMKRKKKFNGGWMLIMFIIGFYFGGHGIIGLLYYYGLL